MTNYDDSGTDGSEGRRERARDSLFLTASLRLGLDASPRDVRVRNLSEGGLMVELAKVVDVGTPVTIDLNGIGEIAGKVAWCTEGRIGIALDTLIDPKKARKPVGAAKTAAATPFHARAPDRR
ncbi:PilZ domain-containing protein [Sphingomonas sp. R86520]|uniref:PilZ domain-containing protein n=1 Tax=Sphingomonas sp. R86520 TaxID=3093859 RepID=UPI0036D29246